MYSPPRVTSSFEYVMLYMQIEVGIFSTLSAMLENQLLLRSMSDSGPRDVPRHGMPDY